MASGRFEGARITGPEDLGAFNLSKDVKLYIGTAATAFARQGDARVLNLFVSAATFLLLRPGDYAPKTFVVASAPLNTLTITAHGLQTGDGPYWVSSDDTLPDGLVAATDYYVVRVDANTIQLAETLAEAMTGDVVDIVDAGAGTHTFGGMPVPGGSTATHGYMPCGIRSGFYQVAAPNVITFAGLDNADFILFWWT